MLRRRHHPQAQAPREAARGQEADEDGGSGGDSAVGVHRGAEVGRGQLRDPSPDEASGVYVHVPFCSAICPYCDFAVRRHRPRDREPYSGALHGELGRAAADWPHPVDTVYLGGGTPSLLAAEELESLLAALRRHLDVEPDVAIHLEANPEDVDAASLRRWRELDVTFLSLGVQSFDDDELRFLGRRHDGRTARRSVELALEAGFPTVSLDLIFGLPDAREDVLRRNLLTALDLGVPHLSAYELEIHPGTVFGKRHRRGTLRPLPEPAQAEHFLLVHRLLSGGGLPAYEVSNFARDPAHRSRHNQKYWSHAPYLGLGPSAHSFDGHRRRWWNEPSLPRWRRLVDQAGSGVAGEERLTDRDLLLEALMLGFRRTDGVDVDRFEARFGVRLEDDTVVRSAIRGGWLQTRGEPRASRVVPTASGLLHADRLAAEVAASAG